MTGQSAGNRFDAFDCAIGVTLALIGIVACSKDSTSPTPPVATAVAVTAGIAQTGVVGLALFIVILVACLRSVILAARAFAARGDPTMELLARALFIGLVGLLVTEFFSTALYSKQLWFLLAACPALLALAQRSLPGERPDDRPHLEGVPVHASP